MVEGGKEEQWKVVGKKSRSNDNQGARAQLGLLLSTPMSNIWVG
jgi:hypothetical protein